MLKCKANGSNPQLYCDRCGNLVSKLVRKVEGGKVIWVCQSCKAGANV